MNLVVASDHGGYDMKEAIRKHLLDKGHEVFDAGTSSGESVSYVDFSQAAAEKIIDGSCERGIVVCGTGIGVSVVANKNPGIRCALCTDEFMVRMARHHNNANMLALGGRVLAIPYALMLVDLFIGQDYDGGRHQSRLDQITSQERRTFCDPEKEYEGVFIFDHPLIQHKLAIMRNKDTATKEFRELVSEVAMLMAYEVTRDLPLRAVDVETPMGLAHCHVIEGKKLALVPILRAGLGMVDGMINLMPMAKVGHIGLYRDPHTLEPVEYYCKLPDDVENRDVILLDPMLATGGSAAAAVDFLKKRHIEHIKFVCLIAAPEGIEKLQSQHPDVPIFCAGLDDYLDDHAYIVPGLGDAGDRLFGTK